MRGLLLQEQLRSWRRMPNGPVRAGRASFLVAAAGPHARPLTDRHLRQWLNRAWVTLPQHFRDAGYYVKVAGKLFHKMMTHTRSTSKLVEPECVASYPYFGQGACPEKPDVLPGSLTRASVAQLNPSAILGMPLLIVPSSKRQSDFACCCA